MSRIAEVIASVERGDPVDWDRVFLLQNLDTVRAGEMFADESVRENTDANERAAEFARQLGSSG